MMSNDELFCATSLDPIIIGTRLPTSSDVKIVAGKGYDVRQPIPIKYQSVRERFLNARKNFWIPNEIPMGEDKLQWESGKLTESEMWLFKTNISYLTAGDNLVPDNLVNVILKYITANEMRQYLRWQIAEESNHIESYLFILESFGLDEQGQGQIFNLYQEMPQLVEKINWNLNFTNNVVDLEDAFRVDKSEYVDSPEFLVSLLKDLFAYYIFEYMFFPIGFAQIFALARNCKLRNTAQQYSYIWRDETLHASNCLWLIQTIIAESNLDAQILTSLKDDFRGILTEAVQYETEHANLVLPNGGIVGYALSSQQEYAQFIADQICHQLNLSPLFHINSHPLPWISEYEINQEVNFFEGRVREYQTGNNLEW
jgi:ribonucleoside-diphosphate reductase beta chain